MSVRHTHANLGAVIEADTPEEAAEKALDLVPTLCTHCTGQTYMLARYHEQDTNDWFVSAKTMESYQRDRGWIK